MQSVEPVLENAIKTLQKVVDVRAALEGRVDSAMHPIPLPGTKMRARIKDPGLDPVIAMTRDRRKKELQTEAQALVVSGLTGAVLHKMLELKTVERDIKELEEGVQEYQDQIDLLNERKRDIQKSQVEKAAWCETFDRLIGPFEAKYEECKAEVKVSFDYAKTKYHESLQKLIEDFGFNPTYKRWFDEF